MVVFVLFLMLATLMWVFRRFLYSATVWISLILVVLTFGALIQAWINYHAREMGFAEPFEMRLSAEKLWQGVDGSQITTGVRRTANKKVLLDLRATVVNRTIRPIASVEYRCDIQGDFINRYIGKVFEVNLSPNTQIEVAHTFFIDTTDRAFDRGQPYDCQLNKITEKR